jgi:hypothetical protein
VLLRPDLYDDEAIVAGQGTAALELIEEKGNLDFLLVPVGGGGLIAGCATAAELEMLVHQYPLGELPSRLILKPVAEDKRNQARRLHPNAGLESGIQMCPLGSESSFPHRHQNHPQIWPAKTTGRSRRIRDQHAGSTFGVWDHTCKDVCQMDAIGSGSGR